MFVEGEKSPTSKQQSKIERGHFYLNISEKLMIGYFEPVFERVMKKSLEEYERMKFEEETFPQESLIKIEVNDDE